MMIGLNSQRLRRNALVESVVVVDVSVISLLMMNAIMISNKENRTLPKASKHSMFGVII